MAVSGIVLIGYLLAHMYGNLKVFAGQAAFDEYAHHLRTIGEPVLPHEGLLWVIRVVLLVAVVAHAYAAFKLWKRNHHGRGGAKRYHAPRAASPGPGTPGPLISPLPLPTEAGDEAGTNPRKKTLTRLF